MEAHKLAAGSQPGINPSSTPEDVLAAETRRRQREVWLEENREGIEAYNELVAEQGVFSTGLRSF
jgi:antitoxin CcdA